MCQSVRVLMAPATPVPPTKKRWVALNFTRILHCDDSTPHYYGGMRCSDEDHKSMRAAKA